MADVPVEMKMQKFEFTQIAQVANREQRRNLGQS